MYHRLAIFLTNRNMKKLLVLLLSLTVVIFAACGVIRDEKQSFIDATVEATCLVFEAEDLFDPTLEGKTKDIYSSYGFDVNDEDAMEALTTKYEEDADVQAAILGAIEECSAGIFSDLEASFADLEPDADLELAEDGEVPEDLEVPGLDAADEDVPPVEAPVLDAADEDVPPVEAPVL